MALIKCDECGRRISDKSICCPNCGYPTHLNKALREAVAARAALPAATDDEKTVDAVAPETVMPAETRPVQTPEPTTADKPEPDALAEYEATLSHPDSPRVNERKKLILYFCVLACLLAIVGSCYYYAKSNHLGSIDEVQCEPVEEVMQEETDVTVAADTASIAGTDSIASGIATAATDASPVTAPDSSATANRPKIETSPSVTQL